MGKRKITCNNVSCKYHISGGGCDTCITLDSSGKCKSFEKGFAYYFHIVWDALGNKNFIDMIEVQRNPDLRIGMYYVMECYELGFSEHLKGSSRGDLHRRTCESHIEPPRGVKASISQNAKCEINVERTETKKQKLTE